MKPNKLKQPKSESDAISAGGFAVRISTAGSVLGSQPTLTFLPSQRKQDQNKRTSRWQAVLIKNLSRQIINKKFTNLTGQLIHLTATGAYSNTEVLS